MTLQEQKIILRILSYEQLAEMFPKAKTPDSFCRAQSRRYWICTRERGHEGIHVRHDLETHHGDLPYAWL